MSMTKPVRSTLAFIVVVSFFALAWSERSPLPSRVEAAADGAATASSARPSEEEARRLARVLHTSIHSTLQHVHHRYYRVDERLPLPAAIIRDVFADLEKEHQIKLRWLAVEGQAMRDSHKPTTAFDLEAVKVLSSGKKEFERVEKGVYERAGAITLINECLKCHVPDRKTTENRTAGLVITIPIRE